MKAKEGKRVGQFPAVKSIVTISRSSVDRLESKGQFPRRIALTEKTSVWDLDEVQEWLEKRVAASAEVAAKRAPIGKQLVKARADARQIEAQQ